MGTPIQRARIAPKRKRPRLTPAEQPSHEVCSLLLNTALPADRTGTLTPRNYGALPGRSTVELGDYEFPLSQ
jgi:hypothetical protein